MPVLTILSQSVTLFNGYPTAEHPEAKNVLECKQLHMRIWSCSVLHTPRCSNMCADAVAVAKLGYSLDPSNVTLFLNEAPSHVVNIVMRQAAM